MKRRLALCASIGCIGLIMFTSCYRMRASKGGGELKGPVTRTTNVDDILLPPGYAIELVDDGFTFPVDVVFDENNTLYVVEAGYAYGEVWEVPKLIRVESDQTTVVAKGERNGPWTGAVFHDGYFYVAEGGEADGGKILRISKSGTIETLVDSLPSVGDHHTNVPVIHHGYIYFGQGTATNSAVVGEDNADFGWLKRKQKFHDIPCGDVVLAGENFETANVLTEDPDDRTITGAYVPFGERTSKGQVIKGAVPCTGSIMRIPIDGGKPEVVAWGLRNPFGLAVSPDGRLYTTENAYDERGSRPVWGTGDVLWEVKQDMWYGWPDFSAGSPVTNDEEFKSPGNDRTKRILMEYPNDPPDPVAILGVHSSSNGLDFSTSESFGHPNEVFIAQFGDMAPKVGKVMSPVGFKVVRVNVNTGVVRDFAVNKGKRNGPASWLKSGGLERPVSVKFDPTGQSIYIVDFGVVRMSEEGTKPDVKTGVIWRVVKK